MFKCYSNEDRPVWLSWITLCLSWSCILFSYRPEVHIIDILSCSLTNISSSNWQGITILVPTPMASGVNKSREILEQYNKANLKYWGHFCMANSKIAHMSIFFLTKSQCLYIENRIMLLTLYKNIIIGLRTCMVNKYSFVCLNLYIACSYQPKIQKWVLISCIGDLARPTSRVAIEIESHFWC